MVNLSAFRVTGNRKEFQASKQAYLCVGTHLSHQRAGAGRTRTANLRLHKETWS